MEQENRKGWSFSKQQYKELAKWAERVALALLVSVVIAAYFEGAQITMALGALFTVGAYSLALSFLRKNRIMITQLIPYITGFVVVLMFWIVTSYWDRKAHRNATHSGA